MKTCPFDKIHNYCSEQECQLWITKTITEPRPPTDKELRIRRRSIDVIYQEYTEEVEITGCAFTLIATSLIDSVNEEDSM